MELTRPYLNLRLKNRESEKKEKARSSMRIPKVRWSACPLGVRYSKSGAGVVVTGTGTLAFYTYTLRYSIFDTQVATSRHHRPLPIYYHQVIVIYGIWPWYRYYSPNPPPAGLHYHSHLQQTRPNPWSLQDAVIDMTAEAEAAGAAAVAPPAPLLLLLLLLLLLPLLLLSLIWMDLETLLMQT